MKPHRPGFRLWRAAALVAAVLVGVVLAALVSQRWWLAPLVAHRLAASSQRAVHFDSIWIGLSRRLEPVVHCRGVRIDNAGWADTGRRFAELDELVAVIAWRSVAEHRPIITLLVLRDGRVDLEREADGRRNWRLSNPDDRGPGRVKILVLRAERASLRFVHRGIDLELEASARPNLPGGSVSAGGDALPARIELAGSWRKVAFSGSVEAAAELTFTDTGRPFALRGRLDAGGARLQLDGRAADIIHEPTFDAKVLVEGGSLEPFRAFVGTHGSGAKRFRIEGRLASGPSRYELSQARARIGATDLDGDVAFTHGASGDTIRAHLTSASTDLADLQWLYGRSSNDRDNARVDSASGSRRSAAPLDGELSFEARRFHADSLAALQSLKLQASATAGRLTVDAVDVGFGGGHVAGRGAVDLRLQPRRAEARFTLRGVRLEALLPAQPQDKRVTGSLQGTLDLQATGDTAAALRASASGRIDLALVGGTISSLLDAEMGLEGGKILRSMIGGSDPIPIRCAAAVIELQHGHGRVRRFALDTEHTRTTATGTIDLADNTIDLVLTPEAKQQGLFVLDRSIRLHGPLRRPAHALVDRAAPTTAGTCAG